MVLDALEDPVPAAVDVGGVEERSGDEADGAVRELDAGEALMFAEAVKDVREDGAGHGEGALNLE